MRCDDLDRCQLDAQEWVLQPAILRLGTVGSEDLSSVCLFYVCTQQRGAHLNLCMGEVVVSCEWKRCFPKLAVLNVKVVRRRGGVV